jgi:tRNA pseudouridine(55) synthase
MQYVIKEAGHTMIQTMDKFKKDNQINLLLNKVCYCGRLDPMARGLVLLLVGDECKNMDKYLGYNKEYEFEIIFGLSSDTDDSMGEILSSKYFDEKEVEYYCDKIKEYIEPKKFTQNFHKYSSKRVNGKPMWEHAQKKICIENPSHEVEIFNVEYSPIKTYDFNEWRHNVIDTINKIDKKNDFRQESIIDMYGSFEFSKIYALPIKIKVSSGFYVRQLVADIKTHLNIDILTYDINRVSINNNYLV